MHIGARHHERGEWPVVELKHVLHHLVLMLLDDAGVNALLQAGRYFLFSHGAGGVSVYTQQLQNRRCGA